MENINSSSFLCFSFAKSRNGEERSLRKGEITTEPGAAAAVYLVGMVAQKGLSHAALFSAKYILRRRNRRLLLFPVFCYLFFEAKDGERNKEEKPGAV